MAGNWKGNFQLQHPFHAQLNFDLPNRVYDYLMQNKCFESHLIFLDVDDLINVTLNEEEPGHFFGTKAVLYSFYIYYDRHLPRRIYRLPKLTISFYFSNIPDSAIAVWDQNLSNCNKI